MREYPKIETVWNRDEKSKAVIPGAWRLPEFALIKSWRATEKIDGTNIRVGLTDDGRLNIGGRTDAAQVPTPLLAHLMATFTPDALKAKFPDTPFTIFGEGYGPKIQNGGAYRSTPGFRIFDVLVGEWWLLADGVADVAKTFGVPVVPDLGVIETVPTTSTELASVIDVSRTAQEDGGSGVRAEGIVVRAEPALFTRKGDRLMWKLKFRDFK